MNSRHASTDNQHGRSRYGESSRSFNSPLLPTQLNYDQTNVYHDTEKNISGDYHESSTEMITISSLDGSCSQAKLGNEPLPELKIAWDAKRNYKNRQPGQRLSRERISCEKIEINGHRPKTSLSNQHVHVPYNESIRSDHQGNGSQLFTNEEATKSNKRSICRCDRLEHVERELEQQKFTEQILKQELNRLKTVIQRTTVMDQNMQQNVQRREDVDRKKSQKQDTEEGLKQELQRLQTIIQGQEDTIQHLQQDLQSVPIAKKEIEKKQIDGLNQEIQRLRTTVQQHEITEQNMLRDLQRLVNIERELAQTQLNVQCLKQEVERLLTVIQQNEGTEHNCQTDLQSLKFMENRLIKKDEEILQMKAENEDLEKRLQKSDREKKSTEKKFKLEKQSLQDRNRSMKRSRTVVVHTGFPENIEDKLDKLQENTEKTLIDLQECVADYNRDIGIIIPCLDKALETMKTMVPGFKQISGNCNLSRKTRLQKSTELRNTKVLDNQKQVFKLQIHDLEKILPRLTEHMQLASKNIEIAKKITNHPVEIVKIHSLLYKHLYSKEGDDSAKTTFSDRESMSHLNKKIQIKNETERAERLDKCLADIQLWTSNVIAEHENMKLSLCQLVDGYERSIFGESISKTDSFSVGELCTLSGHYQNLSSKVDMKMEECVQETILLLQPKITPPKQKFATVELFKITFGAFKTCVDRFGSMNAQLCDAIENSRLNDDEIRQFDERFRPGKSKLNFEELSEKIYDCVNHITQKKLPMLQEVNHERAALHKEATKLNRENTELQILLEDTLNVQETKETELKQKEKTLQSVVSLHEAVKQELDQKKKSLQSVVSLHEAVKQELDQKKKRLEEKEEETNCKICYKDKAKLAYVPCGHVICDTCDRTIKAHCSDRNLHVCSFCKQKVTNEIVVIFP